MYVCHAVSDHVTLEVDDILTSTWQWLTPFITIILIEHFWFRRGYNYDFTAWDDFKKLPAGIPALTVFLIGTVLALLCMSQTWWVGPIALAVGEPPLGTDISWELAVGACFLLYPPLRYLERKRFGL